MQIRRAAITVLAALASAGAFAAETETVWADVTIGPDGRVREIEIDADAHPSLRKLIDDSYRDFTFEPATKDDVTVSSTSGMKVFFEMREDPEKGFGIDIVDYQLHARRLIKVEPVYPKDALADGIEGEVELSFQVNIRGNPKKVRVVRADPTGVFDKAAVKALKQWKFEARTRDGKETRTAETETMVFRLEPEM